MYENRQVCVGISGEKKSVFYMNKGQVAEDCFAPWGCWPTPRLRSLLKGQKKVAGPSYNLTATSRWFLRGEPASGLVTEDTG